MEFITNATIATTNAAILTNSNNDFNNTLMSAIIGCGGVLVGALLTGYLSHISNKKKMKNDLQIEACESIINKLNKLSSLIFGTYTNLFSFNLKGYNDSVLFDGLSDLTKYSANRIKETFQSHKEPSTADSPSLC